MDPEKSVKSESVKAILESVNWDDVGFDPVLNEYVVRQMMRQRFLEATRKGYFIVSEEIMLQHADECVDNLKKNYRIDLSYYLFEPI